MFELKICNAWNKTVCLIAVVVNLEDSTREFWLSVIILTVGMTIRALTEANLQIWGEELPHEGSWVPPPGHFEHRPPTAMLWRIAERTEAQNVT